MDLTLMIFSSVFVLIIITQLFKLCEFVIYCRKISKIPGPPGIIFIGHTLKLMRMTFSEMFTWIEGLSKEFEDGLFKVWIGPKPLIRISKPEHLEMILPSTVNIKKSLIYTLLEPWLGSGLLTSTGEKWVRDRKLITPTFHFHILEQFTGVMSEKAEIMINRIDEEIKKSQGQAIDVYTFVNKCTLDIICETAMGINTHAQDNEELDYVKNVHRFAEIFLHRFMNPWKIGLLYHLSEHGRTAKQVLEDLHNYTEEVIKKRKITRQAEKNALAENKTNSEDVVGRKKRKAFLDLLLDENENSTNPLSDVELREQVDTFMFTGHDTTSAAISWALFCLATYPDVQEKVRKEFKDIFGESKEPATTKQIVELKYFDRVMKEALRLYPSAPEFGRHLVTDVKIGKYNIPKGTNVVMSSYLTHRDPEHWKDPYKFDPDRFLPENMKNRHPYSYIPFSAGPRNCIGQKFAQLEDKILVLAVIRKWRIKAVHKPEDINCYSTLILRSDKGIMIHFTPIE